MNGNPTASQKRFHDWCRDQGCIICGNTPAIHHIKGSKLKLKGCVKPGEHYILPLCHHHHQGDSGVHRDKKRWQVVYGTEKCKWINIIANYMREFGEKPLMEDVYNTIGERA